MAMRFFISLATIGLMTIGEPASAQTQMQMQTLPPLQQAQVSGKVYPDWLRDLSAVDPAVKEAAMQAMITFASQPMYLKQVRKDAAPRIVDILNQPFNTDVSVKVNGALALGMIVPRQDKLDAGLDDKDLKDCVKCLTNLLPNAESIVRLYATTALSNIGAEARAAIPELVRNSKDKASWEIRRAAFAGLSQMAWDKASKEQGPDPRVFRALTDGLADHCLQVKQQAIQGFIYGTGALYIPNDPKKQATAKADHLRAVTALEGLQSHHDKSTAILARLASMHIDPTIVNNPATMDLQVHAINRMLRPPNETQVRIDACYGLSVAWQLANAKQVMKHPDPATFTPNKGWGETVRDSILNLEDRDEGVVWWTCNLVGIMGEAAKKTLPKLEELKTRAKDENLRKKVEWAIARCHGKEVGQVGAADRTKP
jgi:PBS lyase HEAT-like repeat